VHQFYAVDFGPGKEDTCVGSAPPDPCDHVVRRRDGKHGDKGAARSGAAQFQRRHAGTENFLAQLFHLVGYHAGKMGNGLMGRVDAGMRHCEVSGQQSPAQFFGEWLRPTNIPVDRAGAQPHRPAQAGQDGRRPLENSAVHDEKAEPVGGIQERASLDGRQRAMGALSEDQPAQRDRLMVHSAAAVDRVLVREGAQRRRTGGRRESQRVLQAEGECHGDGGG
jgi:hypothetical protein